MVGVYVPNGAKENFFKKLTQRIEQQTYENVVLTGDFNAVSNTQLDRLPVKN